MDVIKSIIDRIGVTGSEPVWMRTKLAASISRLAGFNGHVHLKDAADQWLAFEESHLPAAKEVTSEEDLKRKFEALISEDFYVRPEVEGVNISEGDRVRVDYMIWPKPHLIDEGFENYCLGVEVKHIPCKPGSTGKINRLVWQSITYSQSVFEIDQQKIRAAAVLIFTNNLTPYYESELNSCMGIGHYANLGQLIAFSGKRQGWRINFKKRYFDHDQDGFFINPQAFPRRRTGNVGSR